MIRRAAALVMMMALCASGGPARAGVYSDDLSKCLVKSSSASDQTALIAWMYLAMSAHPALKSYTTITDAQRQAADKTASELMQRLLIVDCHTESVAALKYEGTSTIETAFSVLGQVAMRGLIGDPAVAKEFAGLQKYVDKTKFSDLFKEAGVPTEAATK
ncbi:hypothetical protein [Phenylobacterium montanum]|uniref:Uncharacterized protein n=1 Tax=Phenylobacterium montanum TaxID=2823693 RepID=A0A975ITC1_9CAUL|nr:hypothetical protein [Caulobacter sp. S6]QUD86580.1 hypothetical protein KCG34_15995 [Caulobacter sp. S6]